MDERMQFVARRLAGEPMTELCREFGISHKTGYKIVARHQECGIHGLTDRSRQDGGAVMKLRYDRDEDILIIETGTKGTIDHAEHTGSLISHLSADGNLLLLEVLDASLFHEAALRAGIRDREEELPAS